MGFKRMVEREAIKKALLQEKEKHQAKGEKWDKYLRKWVPIKLPVRKYNDRKHDRHTDISLLNEA